MNVHNILNHGTNSSTLWPLIKHHQATYQLPYLLNVIFHGNQIQQSCTDGDVDAVAFDIISPVGGATIFIIYNWSSSSSFLQQHRVGTCLPEQSMGEFVFSLLCIGKIHYISNLFELSYVSLLLS